LVAPHRALELCVGRGGVGDRLALAKITLTLLERAVSQVLHSFARNGTPATNPSRHAFTVLSSYPLVSCVLFLIAGRLGLGTGELVWPQPSRAKMGARFKIRVRQRLLALGPCPRSPRVTTLRCASDVPGTPRCRPVAVLCALLALAVSARGRSCHRVASWPRWHAMCMVPWSAPLRPRPC
jgi:hypothetical protein